jgi:hypothetical protein
MLPEVVSELVSFAPAVGFSGSRSVAPDPAVVASLAFICPPAVAVGCARGVDAAFRSELPSAVVFRVSDFGFSGRGAFAARSVACVRWVAVRGGGWVSFPSSPCPPGLAPSSSSSRCFSGFGSGSWASLAFAVGCGLPCAVFLGSLPCPVGFGLRSVGGGWFVSSPVVSAQLSVFS